MSDEYRMPRPPLGPKPKWLWLEERAAHIAERISMAVANGQHHTHAGRLAMWSEELAGVLWEIQYEQDEEKRARNEAIHQTFGEPNLRGPFITQTPAKTIEVARAERPD